MTNPQKEFLRLHVILSQDYLSISKQLDVPQSILSEWYEELRQERETIANIKNTWSRKKLVLSFEKFYNWHVSLDRRCTYCGISETEIAELLNSGKLDTKRIQTRGRKLEFDRKNPKLSYEELDNVVLSCYWCNNAKTDTFTFEEFKEIGKSFAAVWKQRLEK
jgi:hypothetical protein